MKFQGDIIITDPCYFVKKHQKAIPKNYYDKKPKMIDFFSYDNEENYPDSIFVNPKDFTETDLISINVFKRWFSQKTEKEIYDLLKEQNLYPKRSKLYKQEEKKYLKALNNWKDPYLSDWDRTDGLNLGLLGFTTYLSSYTYNGDWNCVTYNSNSKKEIGKFCADSGKVCVVLLSELLKYNHYFTFHIEKPWTTTWIRNFDGQICLDIKHEQKEKNLVILGRGNINFQTAMIGF